MAMTKFFKVGFGARALLLWSIVVLSQAPPAGAQVLGKALRGLRVFKQKVEEVSNATNQILNTTDSTIVTADGTVRTVKALIPGASPDQGAAAQAAAPAAPGERGKRYKHTPMGQARGSSGPAISVGGPPPEEPGPSARGSTNDWGTTQARGGVDSGWGTAEGPQGASAQGWGEKREVIAVRPVIKVRNLNAVQGQRIRLACRVTAPDGRPLPGVDAEFVVSDAATSSHALGLARTNENGVARILYVADAALAAHNLSSSIPVWVNVKENDQVIHGTQRGTIVVHLGSTGRSGSSASGPDL